MDGAPPAQPLETQLRDLKTRSTITLVMLAATIAVRMWDVATRGWSMALLRAYDAADEAARLTMISRLDDADRLVDQGALAIQVTLVVTAVAFLSWVHSLVSLTRALAGDSLRWKPGEAVLGFIVPILNWVRPYQILRDVHRQLAPAPAKSVSALLGLWWALFLVANLMGRAGDMTGDAESLDGVLQQYSVAALANAVAIVAAVLAVRVVVGLSARVDARYRRAP